MVRFINCIIHYWRNPIYLYGFQRDNLSLMFINLLCSFFQKLIYVFKTYYWILQILHALVKHKIVFRREIRVIYIMLSNAFNLTTYICIQCIWKRATYKQNETRKHELLAVNFVRTIVSNLELMLVMHFASLCICLSLEWTNLNEHLLYNILVKVT